MAAPEAVRQLIERFESHRESYLAPDYNEAQLRQEFLNPLFAALGWDVYNEKGYADAYKEVIHQAAITIGGRTNAPDYCFRAGGGKASFFVEARKPAVDIAEAVDPACGSGSFLIGAYQHLLDWHRNWYVADGAEKHARGRNPKLYRSATGEWRLTMVERKRVLLANIYGVDIDPQAVEVTKLSLLLKVLEGESKESVNNQLRLFHQRALPALGGNIKCGTSLIGPDFYENRQMALLDEEERYRINAFDWKAEFREVFKGKTGGFDAVMGNPPCVRMETFKSIKDYLREKYTAHEERADLFVYFVEKAIGLISPMGIVGMIVSNKFVRAKYGQPLRSLLGAQAGIATIADFGGAKVFAGATVRTLVLIAGRHRGRTATRYVPAPQPSTVIAFASHQMTVDDYAKRASYALRGGALESSEWDVSPRSHVELLDRLRRRGRALSEWIGARALFGLKTGLNDAFIIDETARAKLAKTSREAASLLRPILFGRDVRRFSIRHSGRFVIYCHPDYDIERCRAIQKRLEPYRKALEKRAGGQKWFELQQPAVGLLPLLRRPKIIYPIIADACRFTLDSDGYYINDKVFLLPTDDMALLALLNSGVANFYFATVCAALEGPRERYLEFRAQYVDPYPVPLSLTDTGQHSRLSNLGEQMLALHTRLAALKPGHARTVLERQIAATDQQIDRLVYELYGLTDAEIAIVEGAGG